MLFVDANTSRPELQCAILNDAGLYARFDECRFLADEYSTDELREAVVRWIEEGDECAAA